MGMSLIQLSFKHILTYAVAVEFRLWSRYGIPQRVERLNNFDVK
jgi:hypothetical protein